MSLVAFTERENATADSGSPARDSFLAADCSLALESQEHQLPCYILTFPKPKLWIEFISSHSGNGKVTGNKFNYVACLLCVWKCTSSDWPYSGIFKFWLSEKMAKPWWQKKVFPPHQMVSLNGTEPAYKGETLIWKKSGVSLSIAKLSQKFKLDACLRSMTSIDHPVKARV